MARAPPDSAASSLAARMSDGLLSRQRCEQIFGSVVEAARSEGVADVEAMLGVGASALTRFANNTIHQNVAERGGYISVRALIDGRTARANSNRFDPESIRGVTRDAIAITRLQAHDPPLLPLAEPRPSPPFERFFHPRAATPPPPPSPASTPAT